MSVPIYGGPTETQIFTYLTGTMSLNKASAVGILANIYKESGFNHKAIGDNGTSYGLCQWHDSPLGTGRWTNLKKYCGNNNLNPTTVTGQLAYLNYELRNSYATLLNILREVPNTAQGCWDAAAQWCARFEIPQGYGSWNDGVLTLGPTSRARGDLARNTFWREYDSVSTSTTKPTNKGSLIVEKAKEYLDKETSYSWGGEGPKYFDCSGFVYRVYKESIDYNWERTTAYYQWRDHGRGVSDLKAGDLIFFVDTTQTGRNPNISHVAIATGNGDEFIHCSTSSGVSISSLSDSYYKSHYHSTKRLVSDSETDFSDIGGGGINTGGVTLVEGISSSPTYSTARVTGEEINSIIGRLDTQNSVDYKDKGKKYGSLVDLLNGEEFKFFVPEYDVDVQANWEDISIIGRSVSIKGYNSTSSRSVSINLTLMAGAGLYEYGKDRVADLHKDVSFVQSLAYPDYSKSIVLPPPLVLLYLGPTLSMKGVVSNVKAKYLKPYDIDLRPMRVDLSFDVIHVTDNPPDYSDVRSGNFEGAMTNGVIDYYYNSENSTS